MKSLGPDLAKLFHITHYNLAQGRQQWNQAALDVKPTANLVTTKFGIVWAVQTAFDRNLSHRAVFELAELDPAMSAQRVFRRVRARRRTGRSGRRRA